MPLDKQEANKSAKVYELPLPVTRPSKSERVITALVLPAGWLYDVMVAGRGMLDEAMAKLQMEDGQAHPAHSRQSPADTKTDWPDQARQELSDLGFNEDEIDRLSPGGMTGPKKLVRRVTMPHHD
jgi:hypothetical protein